MSHSWILQSKSVSLPRHLIHFSSFPRGKPIPQRDKPQQWNMTVAFPISQYLMCPGFNLPLTTAAFGILLVLQTWPLFRRELLGRERDSPFLLYQGEQAQNSENLSDFCRATGEGKYQERSQPNPLFLKMQWSCRNLLPKRITILQPPERHKGGTISQA